MRYLSILLPMTTLPMTIVALSACEPRDEPVAAAEAELEAHDCGCDAKKTKHAPAIDPTLRYAVSAADRPSAGPADALVTVVLFSDFECPYCGRAVASLEALRNKYPSQLRIVFRQLPLPMHARAEELARASLAAQRQDAFWPMHNLLFERQREAAGADLAQWAEELGLYPTRFERDLADPAVAKMVADDVAEAKRFGVKGTPSFFINGRFVVGARPLDELDALVRDELALAERFVRENGTSSADAYEAMRATWLDEPVKR